jgi:uncharacterized DUF497 family protein
MEFDWDEGNIDKNLVKHNVQDWEIEEALLDAQAVVLFRRRVGGEDRRVVLGRSRTSGRYLRVVFVVRIKEGGRFYRPISAIEMSQRERVRYRRGR